MSMGFFLVKRGMTLGGITLSISFLVLALAGHDYRLVYNVTYGIGEADVSQVYLNMYTLPEITLFSATILPILFGLGIAILVISYRQRRRVYA